MFFILYRFSDVINRLDTPDFWILKYLFSNLVKKLNELKCPDSA